MINTDETLADAQAWAKKYKFKFPVVMFNEQKENKEIRKHFTGGMPTFALVSKSGDVIALGEEACKKMIKGL